MGWFNVLDDVEVSLDTKTGRVGSLIHEAESRILNVRMENMEYKCRIWAAVNGLVLKGRGDWQAIVQKDQKGVKHSLASSQSG